MADLKALNARDLPDGFDLNHHSEKPIISVSLEAKTIRIRYIFPGFSFSEQTLEAENGVNPEATVLQHEVGISGAGFLSENDHPLLPSFGRFVQIPPGLQCATSFDLGDSCDHTDIRIKPAQERATDQDDGEIELEGSAYKKDSFYPAEEKMVETTGPLYMDGYRVLCIHVRPFQYNPVKHLLRCYSNIEVSITFKKDTATDWENPTNGEVPLSAYQNATPNLEGFGNFLFNPERKFFEKNAFPGLPAGTSAARPDIPQFLIIFGEAFEKPARKLQNWKEKCGLDTNLVPVSRILGPDGAHLPREDQVNRIKTYLRAQRQAPMSPLRYVLLFGSVETIPTEERQRPDSPLFDTTDYYYFTHRDAKGGECLLPWVSGGRIAALTEKEGLSVVDQIIHYEKNPPDDPEYYGRMTVAAYFEDRDKEAHMDGQADKAYLKTMETIREHMTSHGFQVNRVYVSNTRTPEKYCDGTPVPAKVREEIIDKGDGPLATKKLVGLINEGQLIIGHRGHGDRLGWKNPPLKTEDLDRVDSPRPSVFFSINCRTGSFDGGRDCFAEKVLDLKGGAPSLIASTELSGAWRNDSMIKALFDAIWPGVISTYPVTTMRFPVKYYRIGDIMNYAKAYLMISHGANPNTQKHFEIYHVVGDPTLHIWGSEPMTLRLRTRIKKDILVVNMNTCPQDSVLSLWYKDECLLKINPAGTRMAIPLMLLDKLPPDAQDATRQQAYQLSLYFSAPGHRLAESHLWF
jgi:hypothetical protein